MLKQQICRLYIAGAKVSEEKLLDGPHRVEPGVIARPFKGTKGNYTRLGGDRRDYAVPPPEENFAQCLTVDQKIGVYGVGKIEDIFVKQGLSHAKHTGTNAEGLQLTLDAIAGNTDPKRPTNRPRYAR